MDTVKLPARTIEPWFCMNCSVGAHQRGCYLRSGRLQTERRRNGEVADRGRRRNCSPKVLAKPQQQALCRLWSVHAFDTWNHPEGAHRGRGCFPEEHPTRFIITAITEPAEIVRRTPPCLVCAPQSSHACDSPQTAKLLRGFVPRPGPRRSSPLSGARALLSSLRSSLPGQNRVGACLCVCVCVCVRVCVCVCVCCVTPVLQELTP